MTVKVIESTLLSYVHLNNSRLVRAFLLFRCLPEALHLVSQTLMTMTVLSNYQVSLQHGDQLRIKKCSSASVMMHANAFSI